MEIQELFKKLFHSSVESEVNAVISSLCDRKDVSWCPYGDSESFFGVIENQQASAIPALVEKITNSIDAIMMRKCIENNIDPKSNDAPNSIESAIATFFPNSSNWDLSHARQEQAENIQIIADGPKGETSLVIYDNGEGQHPDRFKETFLSLLKGNKNEIHFVQGKYNMGGSGAIVFCGKQRYQLIASKRFDDTGDFGFTIIRKHPLTDEEKHTKKNTWYEYLTIEDKVPSFKLPSDGIDLGLYNRKFTTGTIIKLYSYNLPSGSKSVISRDLNQSINEYLFQPALPIFTIDIKKRYPDDKNLQRELYGLKRRLEASEEKYLSETFSEEYVDSLIGKYKVTVYVFKQRLDDKSVKESKNSIRREFFKNNMSVLFSLNGQVHGNYTSEFITRALKFNLLKDYLLIHVDCTNMEMDFRNELFMASRDRLKDGEESALLRERLSNNLKKGRLKEVYNKRKEELASHTGSTSNLLKDFSENLPFNSELMKLINDTFDLHKKEGGKPKKRKRKSVPQNQHGGDEQPFSPKRFPSSFKINTKCTEGALPVVQIPINGNRTINFSTDVENQYFDRTDEPGDLKIAILKPKSNGGGGGDAPGEPREAQKLIDVTKSSPNQGTIKVSISPAKPVSVGDQLTVIAQLTSPEGDLEQIFMVKILDKEKKQGRKTQKEDKPEHLGLPQLIEVFQEKSDVNLTCWDDVGYTTFDYDKVMFPYVDNDKLERIYINLDSTILKNFMTKLRGENEINTARNRYLSSVYFHTLFLYMVNKSKNIQISETAIEAGANQELDLSDYLMKIFDSSYTEFLLNFEIAALMENLVE